MTDEEFKIEAGRQIAELYERLESIAPEGADVTAGILCAALALLIQQGVPLERTLAYVETMWPVVASALEQADRADDKPVLQ